MRRAAAVAGAALALLFPGMGDQAYAQKASGYTFSMSTEPYQDLVGAVQAPIGYGETDENPRHIIDLDGEVFTFFGHSYTLKDALGLEISGTGYLRIDDPDNNVGVIIDGIFTTLDTLDETSRISYLIEGPVGDRVVKIEWKRAAFEKGPKGDFINCQVWLYQKSGVMEFRYGPNSVSQATIQEGGLWVGAFAAPLDFSSAIGKSWIGGDPAKPTFDTKANFNFQPLTAAPPSGTVYTLTPKISSSVEDGAKGESGMLIYPNPTEHHVRIGEVAGISPNARFIVSDVVGRTVADGTLNASRLIDTSGWPSGAYLVRVEDGDQLRSGAFVKR